MATGARWSEVQSVKPASIQKNIITFSTTKNGKVRAVPVSESLISFLKIHWAKYGSFTGSLTSFRRVLASTSIRRPKGQAAHALRHTFASHFVMNGGNILTLQKILGHSTVVMTMRHAHLSPDHLQYAVKLNPLGEFDTQITGNKKPQHNQCVRVCFVVEPGGFECLENRWNSKPYPLRVPQMCQRYQKRVFQSSNTACAAPLHSRYGALAV